MSRHHRQYAVIFLCAAGIAFSLLWANPLLAQPNVVADVLQRMDRDRCAALQSGVKVCHYEYVDSLPRRESSNCYAAT